MITINKNNPYLLSADAIIIPIKDQDVFELYETYGLVVSMFVRAGLHPIFLSLADSIKDFIQPHQLGKHLDKSILNTVAISYEGESYARDGWQRIAKRVTVPPPLNEDITTDIFLSHRQVTGHFLACLLYVTLKNKGYKVFLDVETEFNLHDLEALVEKTCIFIVIITPEFFRSYYCHLEYQAAKKYKKPILVVKDNAFDRDYKNGLVKKSDVNQCWIDDGSFDELMSISQGRDPPNCVEYVKTYLQPFFLKLTEKLDGIRSANVNKTQAKQQITRELEHLNKTLTDLKPVLNNSPAVENLITHNNKAIETVNNL